MSERWLPVVGYEGRYEVSDAGRVKSLKRKCKTAHGFRTVPEKILTPQNNHKGYQQVQLSDQNGNDKTNRLVHTLVLEAFVGPRPPGKQTRHIDGTPSHNALSNLVWGTAYENYEDKIVHGTTPVGSRNPNAVLNEEDVREIMSKFPFRTAQSLADEYSVSVDTIYGITSGKTWLNVMLPELV